MLQDRTTWLTEFSNAFPLGLNILVEFSNAYLLYKDEFSKIGCAYTRSEIF